MPNRTYFVDFDGTISRQDSLDLLFHACADPAWVENDRLWEGGTIGSRENLAFAFASFRISKAQMNRVVAGLTVDPTFYEFLDWLLGNKWSCIILSEGLDYIIWRALALNAPATFSSLGRVSVISNSYQNACVTFADNQACCPYLDECKLCSVCKAAVVGRVTGSERIYIGNGLSDRFGILKCELVYAKDKLLDYGANRHLLMLSFASFGDILQMEKNRILSTG